MYSFIDFSQQRGATLKRYKFVIISILMLVSCAERERQNPFDPTGSAPISLSITSRGRRVDLSWSDPNLSNYRGFNVYRRQEPRESNFNLIAAIQSPGTRNISDDNVEFQQLYSYYVTVIGQDQESKPSNTVSITPGPGYNWIVDKWGFQILKTTYDAEHLMLYYYTNYPPVDMALSKKNRIGLITYPSVGLIDVISLMNGELIETIDQISYPYTVAYDSSGASFWLADSSGYLYHIDAMTRNINLISSTFEKPIAIHISEQVGLISVVDSKLKKIVQFDRDGEIRNQITSIDDKSLSGPQNFLHDEQSGRFWLSDGINSMDFIYTRESETGQFLCIDTLPRAGDLELNKFNDNVWLVNLNGFNSSVVQLSPSGTRQLEITELYEPYDISVNKYDGTLLVAESGRGRLIHYNNELQVMGIFSPLNLPVKVIVE